MFKHVYDSFKYLYKNNTKHPEQLGSIYFYSDPHFGDADMAALRIEHSPLKFAPTDEEQVTAINSIVSANDTLIILGDVGDPEPVAKIRAGRKILIKGNHDTGNANYAAYFDEIYEGPVFLSEKILLSHEPIDFPYALNIHGHVHFVGPATEPTNPRVYTVNVCAENLNYQPISLAEIVSLGWLKQITSLHRATIDTAAFRKEQSL